MITQVFYHSLGKQVLSTYTYPEQLALKAAVEQVSGDRAIIEWRLGEEVTDFTKTLPLSPDAKIFLNS